MQQQHPTTHAAAQSHTAAQSTSRIGGALARQGWPVDEDAALAMDDLSDAMRAERMGDDHEAFERAEAAHRHLVNYRRRLAHRIGDKPVPYASAPHAVSADDHRAVFGTYPHGGTASVAPYEPAYRATDEGFGE